VNRSEATEGKVKTPRRKPGVWGTPRRTGAFELAENKKGQNPRP